MPSESPQHVLIIDGDYAARNDIGTYLQRQRYRVSGAVDAREALSLLERDCPDLVILDDDLPDMRGEELLDILRKNTRTKPVPVIFLTVDGSHERFRSAMNRGADDFFVKPVQAREMSEAIAAQLRKIKLRPLKSPPKESVAAAIPGMPAGYSVLGTLAQGGSGTAYIAHSNALGEDCVVKVISLTTNLDHEIIERFSREGRVLQRLSHPNIVRICEYGVLNGHAYLAMELVAGGTLKQMIGAKWDIRQALGLILKVAQGLGAAHAAGVIHRDVKPDNIMLRVDSLEPVLLDFGAARDLHDDQTLTAAGNILGTPSYMAPEIIDGGPAVPATDVYACGVILYELLTGAKLFVGDNPNALMYQHLNFPIPRLPPKAAMLQPLLEALLAKSPADRPGDGKAMSALTGEFLQRLAQ